VLNPRASSGEPEPIAGDTPTTKQGMDMKRYAFALAALATLVSGDAFAQAAGCPTLGLPQPYQRVVNNTIVHVRPFAVVLDAAVDDFGQNGAEDAIAVYCVTKTANAPRGNIAMCLTKEVCPWR
jgi:hypothetical protein